MYLYLLLLFSLITQIDSMMHPLVKGDYPPEFKRIINISSKAEGRIVSRLPTFTEDEIELLKGTYSTICGRY